MTFNCPSSKSLKFHVKYVENGDKYDNSVNGSRIRNHPWAIDWQRRQHWEETRSKEHISCSQKIKTWHTASTSMYSLTFCVRVMSPERHHWKPAVQAAAVMLRTPPSAAVTNQQRAHTPRKLGFALCCHSNATGAPITNPPNSAQLGGSLYHTPQVTSGSVQ